VTPEAEAAAQVLATSTSLSRLTDLSRVDPRLLVPAAAGIGGLLYLLRPHPSVHPSPPSLSLRGEGVPVVDGTGGRTSWIAGRTLSAADAVLRALWAKERRCLAAPHLALRSVSLLHGPSGEGKSRWLSEVVYALIRGTEVFGWRTVQTPVVWVTEEPLAVWKDKGGVVIRDGELSWPWWRRWLRALLPRRFPPTVWVVSLPDLGYEASLPAFRALWRGRVYNLVRRTGARLVIGDTVFALCPQAVADNTTAKVFMVEARWLASKTGCAVELVHHDNDAGRPLGAKMLKGDADYTHHVTRLPRTGEADRRRVVTFGKRYEPVAPDPLVYEMDDDGRLRSVSIGKAPEAILTGGPPIGGDSALPLPTPLPLPAQQPPDPTSILRERAYRSVLPRLTGGTGESEGWVTTGVLVRALVDAGVGVGRSKGYTLLKDLAAAGKLECQSGPGDEARAYRLSQPAQGRAATAP
jgi:hypothetical protein